MGLEQEIINFLPGSHCCLTSRMNPVRFPISIFGVYHLRESAACRTAVMISVRSRSTQLEPSRQCDWPMQNTTRCRARGTATTVSLSSFILRPRIRQIVSDCVLTRQVPFCHTTAEIMSVPYSPPWPPFYRHDRILRNMLVRCVAHITGVVSSNTTNIPRLEQELYLSHHLSFLLVLFSFRVRAFHCIVS